MLGFRPVAMGRTECRPRAAAILGNGEAQVVGLGVGAVLLEPLRDQPSVAEGVQRQEDWDVLAELGCDVIQGYLVARPMREDDLELWAQAWSQRAPR